MAIPVDALHYPTKTCSQETAAPATKNVLSSKATPNWEDFTQETTFHGLRYIFRQELGKPRRFLWALVVLLTLGYFCYQAVGSLSRYREYKTNVDMDVVYNHTIEFPAVTLCNPNQYRISVAVKTGLYDFLDRVYGRNASCQDSRQALSKQVTSSVFTHQRLIDFKLLNSILREPAQTPGGVPDALNDLNLTMFLSMASHQLEDLVHTCSWKGRPCDLQKQFKTSFTKMGVCYTFTGDGSNTNVSNSGSGTGLNMVLNVEQYEYMAGPNNEAGVKILLHDLEDEVLVMDHGFVVAPGTTTLVGVSRQRVLSAKKPYGDCLDDGVPTAKCQLHCQADSVKKECGCLDVYMAGLEGEMCSASQYFSCIEHNCVGGEYNTCECRKGPCQRDVYDASLSSCQISQFSMQRDTFPTQAKRRDITAKFLEARELSQRVRPICDCKGHVVMRRVSNNGTIFKDTLSSFVKAQEDENLFISFLGMIHWFQTGERDIQYTKDFISKEAFSVNIEADIERLHSQFKNGNHQHTFGQFYQQISISSTRLLESFDEYFIPKIDMINSYLRHAFQTDTSAMSPDVSFSRGMIDFLHFNRETVKVMKDFHDEITSLKSFILSTYQDIDFIVENMTNSPVETFFKNLNATKDLLALNNITDDLYNASNLLKMIEDNFNHVETKLENLLTTLTSSGNSLLDSILAFFKELDQLNENGIDDPNTEFFMQNILEVDIFYKELLYQVANNLPLYDWSTLLSDLGGYLGLLLGASILTVCELLDYVTFGMAKAAWKRNFQPHVKHLKSPNAK